MYKKLNSLERRQNRIEKQIAKVKLQMVEMPLSAKAVEEYETFLADAVTKINQHIARIQKCYDIVNSMSKKDFEPYVSMIYAAHHRYILIKSRIVECDGSKNIFENGNFVENKIPRSARIQSILEWLELCSNEKLDEEFAQAISKNESVLVSLTIQYLK